MATATGLRGLASSACLLAPAQTSSTNVRSSVLAGHAQLWTTAGVPLVGLGAGMCSQRRAVVRAAVSEAPPARVGAVNTAGLPVKALMDALDAASRRGAEVIMAAVDKPRDIDYKGKADLVTDTDRKSELAILEVVRERFPEHLILGEEGGVSGDPNSEYLWCIDPVDGTTNFAHGYPSFAVSIAVLYRGRPLAATVVEFTGGPYAWVTRTFSASAGKGHQSALSFKLLFLHSDGASLMLQWPQKRSVDFRMAVTYLGSVDAQVLWLLSQIGLDIAGGGAFCNGHRIHVSSNDMVERALLVTGFGYDHDVAWETNIDLFKHFTDTSRGVRRLGAAAVDCCHVALGIVDSYWEFRLKPWDVAAGVLIVEEAGGKVTRMDGGVFTVFDRTLIVSNGAIHDKLLEKIQPATEKLIADGLDFSQWMKPSGYMADV